MQMTDGDGKVAVFDISWPTSHSPVFSRRSRMRGFGNTPTAKVVLTLKNGVCVELAGEAWRFVDQNLSLSALGTILASPKGQNLLFEFLLDFGWDPMEADQPEDQPAAA